MITVAAVGDVNNLSTYSGTPYHFFQSAKKLGLSREAWTMDLKKLSRERVFWNIKQVFKGQRPGGYQYSDQFRKSLYQQIPENYFRSDVLSFNQHFPLKKDLSNDSKLYLYIDATFNQLLERYGVKNEIGSWIKRKALYWEEKNFSEADYVVGFTEWVRDSVINDYGIEPAKVHSILAGANFILPDNHLIKRFGDKQERPGSDRPFILGWVGKDWKRKGLEILINLAESLIKRDLKVQVHCAGMVPEHIRKKEFVSYFGFINKNENLEGFLDFISACDMGCLFSKAEFSSISVFEFLRLGIPVAGFKVDGMKYIYPSDASLSFDPDENMSNMVDQFEKYILDENSAREIKEKAMAWSDLYSWDRCINEWKELLETGGIKNPVKPKNGLVPYES